MDTLNENQVQNLLNTQKQFYATGRTLSYDYRIKQLDKLYIAINKYTKELEDALKQDLGKSKTESYLSEIGIVLASINHTKKNLKKWMKKKKVKTPIHSFGAKSFVSYEPYGSVLIMGPFNYPLQLLIEPLISAISAGNCCVLSPSELTENVSKLIQNIIKETFPMEYIYCTDGKRETNIKLLKCKFDYIFFTGSANVGKIVMSHASENLTPITLELGGKSPVIIDKTANLDVVCKRLVWGKFMNSGQTCVAPDYVFVHKEIYDKFLQTLKDTIILFYGKDIKNNDDYGRIINQKHIQRLVNILTSDKDYIYYGGNYDIAQKFIEPTILTPTNYDVSCMKEELFGPILPVFKYDDINKVIEFITAFHTPLALYIFSEDKLFINNILASVPSGGVSINDTISHIINPHLPFGGKGYSGMGEYHGKYGFLTFSHKRAILSKTTKIDITLPFPPYSDKKLEKLKRIFK